MHGGADFRLPDWMLYTSAPDSAKGPSLANDPKLVVVTEETHVEEAAKWQPIPAELHGLCTGRFTAEAAQHACVRTFRRAENHVTQQVPLTLDAHHQFVCITTSLASVTGPPGGPETEAVMTPGVYIAREDMGWGTGIVPLVAGESIILKGDASGNCHGYMFATLNCDDAIVLRAPYFPTTERPRSFTTELLRSGAELGAAMLDRVGSFRSRGSSMDSNASPSPHRRRGPSMAKIQEDGTQQRPADV